MVGDGLGFLRRTMFVAVGPLLSEIILGIRRTRRGAGDNVVLSSTTRRGPRFTSIITINPNNIISNGRMGVCIDMNSGIVTDGCTNARMGVSNRRCAVMGRSSVLTALRWLAGCARMVCGNWAGHVQQEDGGDFGRECQPTH